MKLFFSTPHGNYPLQKWNLDQNLREICFQNQIPFQSVSFYGKQQDELCLIVGLHQPLSNFAVFYEEIFIKSDRNIDYNKIINKKIQTKPCSNPVSEYVFSSETGEEELHFELSQSECRRLVEEKVTHFLQNEITIDPSRKIILGLSGGGDSNTLVSSFLASNLVKKEQLIGVMMLGVPDWDLGAPRARSICDEHGIELKFVDSSMINQLLGRKDGRDWVEDFEKCFPYADFEGIGSHCLHLAFRHMAKQESAQAVVTGLNLEDILAECFLKTMQGKLPPPFPVRTVDHVSYWHPLYNIPKKVLDGCYPRFSLQNYNDRYPSRLLGRAIPYYISQFIHCLAPGIEFDFVNGFKELAKLNKNYGCYDPDLGFSTLEPLSSEMREQWKHYTVDS
jgi:hypothetical protein